MYNIDDGEKHASFLGNSKVISLIINQMLTQRDLSGRHGRRKRNEKTAN